MTFVLKTSFPFKQQPYLNNIKYFLYYFLMSLVFMFGDLANI